MCICLFSWCIAAALSSVSQCFSIRRESLGQSENGASFFAPDAVVDEADRLTWTTAAKIQCQEHTLRGKLGIAMCCKKLNRIDEARNAIGDGLSFVRPLYNDAPLSTRQIAACLIGELAYLLIGIYLQCIYAIILQAFPWQPNPNDLRKYCHDYAVAMLAMHGRQ